MITQEYLKKYIHYCPLTGVFTYKKRDISDFHKAGYAKYWNNKFAGKSATHLNKNGTVYITIRDKRYLATKIAFLDQTGKYPKHEIHHIDGNSSNNKFSNFILLKKSNSPLTQERLKELFSYDQNTGIFTRLLPTSSRSKKGMVAGSKYKTGYLFICIDGNRYLAHRLAWLYVYGVFPEKQLDHINQIKYENRIINLREANASENAQNRPDISQKKNKSGYYGVCHNKFKKNKPEWFAQIKLNGKTVYLEYFDDPKQAHESYLNEKRKLHKFCTI